MGLYGAFGGNLHDLDWQDVENPRSEIVFVVDMGGTDSGAFAPLVSALKEFARIHRLPESTMLVGDADT